MSYELGKLLSAYKEHGKIIVGVDFDDTFFPLTNNEYIIKRCSIVVDLLKQIAPISCICLYTVASNQELKYKVSIMQLNGVEPNCVNSSPVTFGESIKPYFNILLDDKAGLNESIEILKEFIKHTQNN